MTEIVFSSGHLPADTEAETRALCQMYTIYIYFGIMLARLDFELGICTAYVVIYNKLHVNTGLSAELHLPLQRLYHLRSFQWVKKALLANY